MPRNRLIVIGVVLVLIAAIGAGFAYYVTGRKSADPPPNTHPPAPTTATTTAPPPPAPKHRTPAYGPDWPTYGRTLSRTRDASEMTSIHPPFHVEWQRRGGGLLEYPPTYSHGVLYEAADSGWVTARSVFTGRMYWAHKLDTVLASPTIGKRFLYMPSYDGRLYALSRKTGHVAWSAYMGGEIEGSPALWHGRVYEGTLSGSMRAFNASNGHPLWSLSVSGAIKHGPAIAGGRLYFGDYGGSMWGVNALSGRVVWRSSLGGEFYSTPAVANGHVYVGNNDGTVYSLGASNGRVSWSTGLGGWAYGSPAVSHGRVFATAYNGMFAAIDARTGGVLWRHQLPYGTLASPAVIGRNVYVADRGPSASSKGQLFAYNPGNGKRVWSFPDGKFSSVIAAANRLIVAGFFELYSLKPR